MSEQLSALVRAGVDGDGSGGAHLVFDPSDGTIVFADAAASALFGFDGAGQFVRASDLIAELTDGSPRQFVARAATVRGARDLSVTLEPLHGRRDGSRSRPVLAILRSLEGEAAALAVPRVQREERLESLWSLVVRRGLAGPEQVRTILREALAGLELETATVGHVEDGDFVIVFASHEEEAGTRVPLDRSAARSAIEGAGTYVILDARNDPARTTAPFDARCIVSAAFRVESERWAVTFASPSPRERAFEVADWRYLDHVVEALARAIERRQSDARFERLAFSDALTALPNRAALLTRIDEALAESARIGGRTAVLFLDVDGFKTVNDTVGHRGGDIVLAEVAQRLRSTLRREEYLGRLGGDEFAIVIPQIDDRAELEAIAQRIGGVLTYPFAIDECQFALSASIGVAVYPDDGRGREELLASADAAMYVAKGAGGSRVRFRDVSRNGTVGTLPPPQPAPDPNALGLVLCYQPILDAASGRVTSAEALVRRIHPTQGLLAPEHGWSIAQDETGRRALDRYVLREATAQAAAWQRMGMSIRIDVNLAAYDVRDIDELLGDEALGGDARRLRVEIGASHFTRDDASLLPELVARGAARGVAFSLDGFDGSLATLASLAEFPIEAIKLDRPLVDAALQSRPMRAVIEGTMIVARSLGWRVIAKGVETQSQLDALVALGCDGIQGFFVARPMTAEEFGAWLAERRYVYREGDGPIERTG